MNCKVKKTQILLDFKVNANRLPWFLNRVKKIVKTKTI